MLRRTGVFIVAVVLSLVAGTLGAEETSRDLWIEVKCALCHGEDGASTTVTGKKVSAPDLRSKEIQELADAEIEKCITKGQEKMPSFQRQLTVEEVKMLLDYVRELGRKQVENKTSGRN